MSKLHDEIAWWAGVVVAAVTAIQLGFDLSPALHTVIAVVSIIAGAIITRSKVTPT